MYNYGNAIKSQRELFGYSQTALSKKTNISQQIISKWERNETIPSIDMCVQLAQFYGITIDELIGLEPKDQTNEKQKTALHALSSSAVNFSKEYQDIISDKNFIDMSKLYKAVKPELRALMLGYIVGILQSQGVNTKSILGY